MTWTCRDCGPQPSENFYVHPQGGLTHHSYCKTCHGKRNRKEVMKVRATNEAEGLPRSFKRRLTQQKIQATVWLFAMITKGYKMTYESDDLDSYPDEERLMPGHKKCGRCKAPLPLSAFGPHPGNKDGLQSKCAACRREYQADLRNKKRGCEPREYSRDDCEEEATECLLEPSPVDTGVVVFIEPKSSFASLDKFFRAPTGRKVGWKTV